MACCIIAAFLYAQLKQLLWRWAAYWGLARVPAGIDYPTVYVRLARRLRRKFEIVPAPEQRSGHARP